MSGRLRIVVATSNPGKLDEMREILADLPIEWLGLADVAPVRFPDEGADYEANARAKALAVAEQLGEWALADDSGLEVDALGGAPGPLSARFGGPGLDDRGRVERLLDELRKGGSRPAEDLARTARFVCVAALAAPSGEVEVARGVVEGRICDAPRGEGGFGYDPVFEVAARERDAAVEPGQEATMAEIPSAEKNRISHRARALSALRPRLQTISAARRSSR